MKDQLERLLVDGDTAAGRNDSVAHLKACAGCSAELFAMKATALQLRLLKGTDDLEPAAGFYARVLQRIEKRTRISEWGAFLYSPFSKRLAYASLSAALLLGAYVVTEETRDGHLRSPGLSQATMQVTGSQAEQRDAVLVNFASFDGPPQ